MDLFQQLEALIVQPPTSALRTKAKRTLAEMEKQDPQGVLAHLTENPAFEKTLRAWLEPEGRFLKVFNPTHYQSLREVLAQNRFQAMDGSPWPTAQLGSKGHAQLIPAALDPQGSLAPEELGAWSHLMWQQREQLSDLTVDVLDTLGAIWLKMAKTPEDDAVADLNSLLTIRGLKQRTGRSGEERGYRESQRMEIFQSLVQIQNLWLTLGQFESVERSRKGYQKRKVQTLQSRAFVITDRLGQLRLDGCIDVEKFIFRPGKVFGQFLFGPGRQTALLSAKALSYDPYRQAWEKRLTRYLSWHWRVSHIESDGHRYSLETLLHSVDSKLRKTQKTRDRLEKALDKLQADSIIQGWRYSDDGTKEVWVLPPLSSPSLESLVQNMQEPPTMSGPSESSLLGGRVRNLRRKHKLTQALLAQQWEISQGYLSLLEGGRLESRQISETLRTKIYDWLEAV